MSDLDVYKQQGFGNRSGFGTRPALVIVDFVNGFNDPALFGGGNIPAAIEHTAELLAACRRHAVPVAYTRVVYAEDGSDLGVFAMKTTGLPLLIAADQEGGNVVRIKTTYPLPSALARFRFDVNAQTTTVLMRL